MKLSKRRIKKIEEIIENMKPKRIKFMYFFLYIRGKDFDNFVLHGKIGDYPLTPEQNYALKSKDPYLLKNLELTEEQEKYAMQVFEKKWGPMWREQFKWK